MHNKGEGGRGVAKVGAPLELLAHGDGMRAALWYQNCWREEMEMRAAL